MLYRKENASMHPPKTEHCELFGSTLLMYRPEDDELCTKHAPNVKYDKIKLF